jgi:phosphoribosylformimino-5-aminoimidazole carboxamide ribotide isomerase
MFVIPSIDILNGKCVQLTNGKTETAEIYGDPKDYFEKWVKKGADVIHIIDLDAVFNLGSNKEIIYELIENDNAEIQVGGGIRNKELAYEFIKKGAKRIIIGSKALDIDFLRQLGKKTQKEQIMAALDIRSENIVFDGWQTDTKIKYKGGVKKIRPYIGSVLSTDVTSEGLLEGTNYDLLKIMINKTIPTYASGGFTTRKDIELAQELGFSGVIIGKALYTRKLNLEDLW